MSKPSKMVPTSGLGRFNQIKPLTNVFFSLLFIILALLTVLPVIFVFIISISSEASIAANGYSFFPTEFSGAAYEYLWNSKDYIGRAFLNSIGITSLPSRNQRTNASAPTISQRILSLDILSHHDIPTVQWQTAIVFF